MWAILAVVVAALVMFALLSPDRWWTAATAVIVGAFTLLIVCDPGASAHIVSLRHARHRPDVTAARLASEHRIICGGRGDGLRISLHAYNDEADVDRLAEALREM